MQTLKQIVFCMGVSIFRSQCILCNSELNEKLRQINFVTKFPIDRLYIFTDIKILIAWGSTSRHIRGGLGIYNTKQRKWIEFKDEFIIRGMDVKVSSDLKFMAITNGDLPWHIPVIYDISKTIESGDYAKIIELPFIQGERKEDSGGDFITGVDGKTKFITYSQKNGQFEIWDIFKGTLDKVLPYKPEAGQEFERFVVNKTRDIFVESSHKKSKINTYLTISIDQLRIESSTEELFLKNYEHQLNFDIKKEKRQWIILDGKFLAYSDITIDENKHVYFKLYSRDDASDACAWAVKEQLCHLVYLVRYSHTDWVKEQKNEIQKMLKGNVGNVRFWLKLNQYIDNLRFETQEETLLAQKIWIYIQNSHATIERTHK